MYSAQPNGRPRDSLSWSELRGMMRPRTRGSQSVLPSAGTCSVQQRPTNPMAISARSRIGSCLGGTLRDTVSLRFHVGVGHVGSGASGARPPVSAICTVPLNLILGLYVAPHCEIPIFVSKAENVPIFAHRAVGETQRQSEL